MQSQLLGDLKWANTTGKEKGMTTSPNMDENKFLSSSATTSPNTGLSLSHTHTRTDFGSSFWTRLWVSPWQEPDFASAQTWTFRLSVAPSLIMPNVSDECKYDNNSKIDFYITVVLDSTMIQKK